MAMIQAQTQTQWNDKVVEYISYDVSYYQLNWYIKVDVEYNNLCGLDIETYVLSTSVIHNNNPVHEHNHTRILVPEVLCVLVGPEAQNVPSMNPR